MALSIALTATLRRLLDIALIALVGVVLSALIVARLIPAVTGLPTYVVGGGSMQPTIPLGAVVVPERVGPTDLQVGDIVTLQVGTQHAVFTHRITRLVTRDGALWIETKGDANPTVDPSIIPATDVVGRVNTTVPYIGYVVQLLSLPQGVVFLVASGLLLLLVAWVLESLEEDQRAFVYRRRLAQVDVIPIDSVEGAPG